MCWVTRVGTMSAREPSNFRVRSGRSQKVKTPSAPPPCDIIGPEPLTAKLRLRLLRAHRPRPRRARAHLRPPQPPHQSHPQRIRRPGLQHQRDDLRRVGNDCFPVPGDDFGAGIPDYDGDAAGDRGDEGP